MTQLLIVATILIFAAALGGFGIGLTWQNDIPTAGTILVVSDEDGAHLFLYLDEDIDGFANQKYVTMKVSQQEPNKQ